MVLSVIDTCIKSVGKRVKCVGLGVVFFFPFPLPVVEICAKKSFWALDTMLERKSLHTPFLPSFLGHV